MISDPLVHKKLEKQLMSLIEWQRINRHLNQRSEMLSGISRGWDSSD